MNKICTSLEQSKKLIKLGIDVNTADMYWWSSGKRNYIDAMDDGDFDEEEGHIRAWSLTALLEIIPNIEIRSKVQNFKNKSWCISSHDDKDHNHIWAYGDELVDACVELIYKLKEQNHDTKRRKRTSSKIIFP